MSKKERIAGQERIHTESRSAAAHEFEDHTADSVKTDAHVSKSGIGAYSQEGYKFVVSDGVVTSVAEVEHGLTKIKSIKPYVTFSLSGTDVLKTESKGAFQEISRYTDDNNDGIYQKASETMIFNGAHREELRYGHADDYYADVDHGAGPTVDLVGLTHDMPEEGHWF